jgi:hypothetical protein
MSFWRADAIADVPDAALEPELVRGEDVEVRATGELPVPVPRHDADVVVIVPDR